MGHSKPVLSRDILSELHKLACEAVPPCRLRLYSRLQLLHVEGRSFANASKLTSSVQLKYFEPAGRGHEAFAADDLEDQATRQVGIVGLGCAL